jgi:hypothetical protein
MEQDARQDYLRAARAHRPETKLGGRSAAHGIYNYRRARTRGERSLACVFVSLDFALFIPTFTPLVNLEIHSRGPLQWSIFDAVEKQAGSAQAAVSRGGRLQSRPQERYRKLVTRPVTAGVVARCKEKRWPIAGGPRRAAEGSHEPQRRVRHERASARVWSE